MPYRKILEKLKRDHIINGCIILDPYGNVWWHTGSFLQSDGALVDGYYLLSEWVTFPPTVRVAGVKFNSLINAYPKYWCLTNPDGHGSLILHITKNKYYFLCFTATEDPIKVQKQIAKMANLFG